MGTPSYMSPEQAEGRPVDKRADVRSFGVDLARVLEAREPISVVGSEFNEANARFSPDGRWFSYSSNESGAYEIYVRPFNLDAGPGEPLSVGGRVMVSKGGATPGRALLACRRQGIVLRRAGWNAHGRGRQCRADLQRERLTAGVVQGAAERRVFRCREGRSALSDAGAGRRRSGCATVQGGVELDLDARITPSALRRYAATSCCELPSAVGEVTQQARAVAAPRAAVHAQRASSAPRARDFRGWPPSAARARNNPSAVETLRSARGCPRRDRDLAVAALREQIAAKERARRRVEHQPAFPRMRHVRRVEPAKSCAHPSANSSPSARPAARGPRSRRRRPPRRAGCRTGPLAARQQETG